VSTTLLFLDADLGHVTVFHVARPINIMRPLFGDG
jgi:hypothetical protein